MTVYELNESTLDQFKQAIHQIQSDTVPQWGSMNAAQMLHHLDKAIKSTSGEEEPVDQSNFLTVWVLRPLFFHIFTTWPGGKIKGPPEMFTSDPGDFEEIKVQLLATMDRMIERTAAEPNKKILNPFFGKVTLEYSRWTNGLHMRHHLRQFGVMD